MRKRLWVSALMVTENVEPRVSRTFKWFLTQVRKDITNFQKKVPKFNFL